MLTRYADRIASVLPWALHSRERSSDFLSAAPTGPRRNEWTRRPIWHILQIRLWEFFFQFKIKYFALTNVFIWRGKNIGIYETMKNRQKFWKNWWTSRTQIPSKRRCLLRGGRSVRGAYTHKKNLVHWFLWSSWWLSSTTSPDRSSASVSKGILG